MRETEIYRGVYMALRRDKETRGAGLSENAGTVTGGVE